MLQAGLGYTPTPVISHAILTDNHERGAGLADGVVITPSPQPARRRRLQVQPARRAARLTQARPERSRTVPTRSCATTCATSSAQAFQKALALPTTHDHDYITPYVADLGSGAGPTKRRSSWPEDRSRSDGRCGSGVLGTYRRALRAGHHRCEPGRRPHLLLHDRGQGWQDPHGLLLALCHGQPDRPEGPLRHRLWQRPRL